MAEKTYGYARVSSRDQNLERQLDAFSEFGLEKTQIFSDKASGKEFKRPQYQKLMRRLRKGDVLVIKSIDRLGRNYEEIIEEWRRITKEKGANVVVLDMPLLDTREPKTTSRVRSSRIWFCSCSPTSHRSSARTSTSVRRRALRQRKPGASSSEDRQ